MYRVLAWTSSAICAMVLAAIAAAQAVNLAYKPEDGLRVPYDIAVQGTVLLKARGQVVSEQKVSFSARRVDTVQRLTAKGVVLERRFERAVLEVDGKTQNWPAGFIGTGFLFDVDSRGRVKPQKESWLPAGVAPIVADMLNVVETVPFAEGPVDYGDIWDASGSDEDTPSNVKEIRSRSDGRLLQIYESDGMEVALIEQVVDAEFRISPSAPDAPVTRVSMLAKVLQSNRIEDGCLLGIRGALSLRNELLAPDGSVAAAMEVPELRGTLQVAQE